MKKYTPKFGIIETTLACNFNCKHCGSLAGKKRDCELTLEDIDNVLRDLKVLGCLQVSYMGGEFFLRKDWRDILKLTDSYGFKYAVATNGYLLNKKVIKELKALNIGGISISLDSADEKQHDELRGKKGAFNKVMENLYKLGEFNIPTAVYTTVNKQNVSQLKPILELLLNTGLSLQWKIILASNHNSLFTKKYQIDEKTFVKTAKFISKNKKKYNKSDSKIYIEESHDIGYCSAKYGNLSENFQKTGCIAGVEHFGIQSNGNVKGCLSLQDDFIEGNIRERSFKEIWEDASAFSYTRNFDKSMLEGICKGCSKALSDKCKGGCRDFSHSATGSMFKTPFCLHNIENRSTK